MTMKRKLLAVSLPLLVGLGCVWLATDTFSQPVLLGGPPVADLVVEKVTLQSAGGDRRVAVELVVTVKNIGNVTAPRCTVALCTTGDVTATPYAGVPFTVHHAEVPTLQPKASTDILFKELLGMLPDKRGMCIVAVDAPVEGRDVGQVNEWPGMALKPWGGNTKAGEHNNVFGFAFDLNSVQEPFTWTNPAVE